MNTKYSKILKAIITDTIQSCIRRYRPRNYWAKDVMYVRRQSAIGAFAPNGLEIQVRINCYRPITWFFPVRFQVEEKELSERVAIGGA